MTSRRQVPRIAAVGIDERWTTVACSSPILAIREGSAIVTMPPMRECDNFKSCVPKYASKNPTGNAEIYCPYECKTRTPNLFKERPRCSVNSLPGVSKESQYKDFFKASWIEDSREKEADIIKEAYTRSRNLLGPYSHYVTEHLPVVKCSGIVRGSSTGIFRDIVGYPEKKARSLVWIVSEYLEPLSDCRPGDFWRGLWQLIRCHYLLWHIGVAHCDISIRNLMRVPSSRSPRLRAILNDFDLAALMPPGQALLDKKGYEYVGTLPFMSVELLLACDHNFSTPRCYRYDLESFFWCLLWQAKRGDFPEDAVDGTYDEAAGAKLVMLSKIGREKAPRGFEFLWGFVLQWIYYWWLNNMPSPILPEDHLPLQYFFEAVDRFPEAKAVLKGDGIDDREWMPFTPAATGSDTSVVADSSCE